jgi:hypothetical protein
MRTILQKRTTKGLVGKMVAFLEGHASTNPVWSIGFIDGTCAEVDVAQGAILSDLLAVSPEVCADRVVRVGSVHYGREESENRNRNGKQDHQGNDSCPQLHQSFTED